ncbi:mechanosensitive ion channel family protein [uncultured Sulfitobacter sp.]|uniref:mechanosensitive ion channel family protein n=1 Tax=uncultured Sulfitobacter sp. TaxID=191468 RepID=UPI00261CAC57|nr:mechanosensitive ion channel family protein [uncultured Sulfitobacter sp.]
MIFRILLACLIWISLSIMPLTGAQAQGLSNLLYGEAETVEQAAPTESETLAETLRNAARDGVDIIVIDTEGRVITKGEPDVSASVSAAPTAEDYSRLMTAQENVDRARDQLIDRLSNMPVAVQEVLYILRAASPDGTIMLFAQILGMSLLLFGIGVLFEREVFGKRILRRFVVARVQDAPTGYAEKMPFLVFRFAVGVVGILVSMAVAYIIGVAFFPPLDDSAVQFTVTLINIGYFCCRFVAGLWRMILSPFLSQYRIPVFSDRDAKRLHRWMYLLACFDICAILFGIWIGELGLNYDVYALVAAMLSAAVVTFNIVLVIVNRTAVSNALRRGKSPAQVGLLLRILSRAWAPAVIFYVLFAWFELTYDLIFENPSSIPLIAGAYGILISIIVVYGVVNYVIERGFARARVLRLLREKQAEMEIAEQERLEREALARKMLREDGPDPDPDTALEGDTPAGPLAERIEPAQSVKAPTAADLTQAEHDMLSATAEEHGQPVRVLNSFEALARRVAGILAFVAGAYAFFYIWDNDGARMVESVLDRVLDIIIIIFIGYVVYHAFRIWIDTKIAEETDDEITAEPGDEGSASSASRLATLLPLFRNFTLIVVVVTIILIVLMEVGINVGPLFAGAGIVGVAVGFGSQALVRDIFAGAFFLFDDAFRKGEYLDVGGVKGTVEKISVRSFQLRHHLGALHTIPFGELQVMTNYSRDWVIMKLPLRVTYDTDVEKVRKLIKKLGIALLDDPVIGQNFIAPLKSQGVIEMQDSAMIIRVKFMTKPGDQWLVRKRVYEEIRALFEREGIKFAHREVTVRLADAKVDDLTEAQKREIAAAAHASIEEETEAGEAQDGDDR